jgi:hypothetical protein
MRGELVRLRGRNEGRAEMYRPERELRSGFMCGTAFSDDDRSEEE